MNEASLNGETIRSSAIRYELLDPLRGLAALWVLLFHYPFGAAFVESFPLVDAFFARGNLGVPLFFVISGFCITGAAQGVLVRRRSTGHFLRRRLRRIFPPFWISLLVAVALPFLLELISSLKTGHLVFPERGSLTRYFDFDVMTWLRVVTLTEVFTPMPSIDLLDGKFAPINSVYWTLAIELQFYFVVAVALCVPRYFYRTMLLVTIASTPLVLDPSSPLVGWCFPYWPMFALGVLLYWLAWKGYVLSCALGPRALAAVSIGVIAVGVALIANMNWSEKTPLTYLKFAAIISCFAYVGLDWREAYARSVRESRWFLVRIMARGVGLLGLISYSLYIVHTKMMFLSRQFARQFAPSNSLLFDVTAVVLTVLLSYGFFLIAERPFLHKRDASNARGEPENQESRRRGKACV